jgi:uncharacterized protein (DUF1684 family)
VYRNIELSKKKRITRIICFTVFRLTGKESYIGGRYIDLRVPAGNTLTIDFNTAYNHIARTIRSILVR